MSEENREAGPVEETFFDFECPYCAQTVSFPSTAAGEASECFQCQETLVVPTPGSSAGLRLPIPIVTERLTLRRFQDSDEDDLMEFVADEELFQFINPPMDPREIQQWIAINGPMSFTRPDQPFYLAIVRNDTSKVIGWVSLAVAMPTRKQATVSVLVGPKHQRNGFGTEALRGVLSFCFAINLHRMRASCDGRNKAACGMMEKAGMRCEAKFIEDQEALHGWADTMWFALLKREWK